MEEKRRKICIYLVSFVIPVMLYTIYLYIKGITPFGDIMLINGDSLGQYVQFFTELSEKLKNGENLLYSWNYGLGINYVSQAAYYLISPFNILLIFFDKYTMPMAFVMLILLKMGLSGITMSRYLLVHFYGDKDIDRKQGLLICAFSISYALSTYYINRCDNQMWMDCYWLFPLIILSLERLVEGKKSYMYTIWLGLAIMTNFSIGYMICLFCVIYFAYLFIINYKISELIKNIKVVARFAVYSLMAGVLSAVVTLPTICALSSTSSVTREFVKNVPTFYPFYFTIYRMMVKANPVFMNHPLIHSTVLALLLIPIYITCKKIPIKERVAKIVLIFLLALSFQVKILDFVWNAFHRTNGLNGRFAFIFVFLSLVICYEAIIKNELFKCNKEILFSYILTLVAIFICNRYFDYSDVWQAIQWNVAILTVSLIVMMKIRNRKIVYLIITAIMVMECCLELDDGIVRSGNSYGQYLDELEKVDKMIECMDDSGFLRVRNESAFSYNESVMMGYGSVACYTSMLNYDLEKMLYRLGCNCTLNIITDLSWESVTENMMGIKYILTDNPYLDNASLKKSYEENGKYLYINEDTLSVMFKFSDKTSTEIKLEGDNPFEVVNNLAFQSMGIDNVYQKAKMVNEGNKVYIEVPEGCELYLYSKNILRDSYLETKEGKYILYNHDNRGFEMMDRTIDNNYVYYVAESNMGGKIEIPEGCSKEDINAYILNIENYRRLMDSLSEEQLDIEHFSAGVVRGNMKVKTSGVVFTSIPYDEGWNLKIDGKKTKYTDLDKGLIIFDLESGEHEIEFTYVPKGYRLGIILSCGAMFFIIMMVICERKNIKL